MRDSSSDLSGPGVDGGGDGGGARIDGSSGLTPLSKLCANNVGFAQVGDSTKASPDYDRYKPTYGSHCAGTDHQAIAGVQKVVFLGDSLTTGSLPTAPWDYYRERLTRKLKQKFGSGIEVKSCALGGSVVQDLLAKQLLTCFSGVEAKTTLVVMTIGGNDLVVWAQAGLKSTTLKDIYVQVDSTAAAMGSAVKWLKDPKRFPKGVFVVYANVYEYTDKTGDLSSCPMSFTVGLSGKWADGNAVLARLNEHYMKIAVENGADLVFLREHFCGHGFQAKTASGACHRGSTSATWFDLTCIHPTGTGHGQVADLFWKVIES